jgi:DNA-binding NarL/FixJ family response regulator
MAPKDKTTVALPAISAVRGKERGDSPSNDEAWTGESGRDVGVYCAVVRGGADVDGFIAIVESRTFVRECILQSMQTAFSFPVVACSTVWELEPLLRDASAKVVILSLMDASKQDCASALKVCLELVPSAPTVVLGSANDVDLALTAIRHGARGYIPCTMGFEIAVEAVRFVLAGGTYVPMDGLLAADWSDPRSQIRQSSTGLTARELAVVQRIQHGKSNKLIAYELNLAESTVKAHVHNIIRKLQAKNRTEAAIKAQTALERGIEGRKGGRK